MAPQRQLAEFDIFIDLSGSLLDPNGITSHIQKLRAVSELVVTGRRISLALPNAAMAAGGDYSGFDARRERPAEALGAALLVASEHGRGLAIIQGTWLPSSETIAAMVSSHPRAAWPW